MRQRLQRRRVHRRVSGSAQNALVVICPHSSIMVDAYFAVGELPAKSYRPTNDSSAQPQAAPNSLYGGSPLRADCRLQRGVGPFIGGLRLCQFLFGTASMSSARALRKL